MIKQILFIHIYNLVFLASVLMEEICHCLLERRKLKLKKQSFELLITPHLTNLDFSIGQLTDVPYILNLAALRCRVRDFRSFTIHDHKIIQSHLFLGRANCKDGLLSQLCGYFCTFLCHEV
jgi:hypothetical protein